MERKSGGRNKRSNELTAEKKKWQTKFHNLHEKKKSIENQASWKKTTNCDAEWLRHLSLLILKK